MIELKNVTKEYGVTKALDNASFRIEKGEIIGFVGPNGAGKSTTMKIITTYTAPTSGTAVVGGYDVVENPYEVRKMIGYLPEMVPLYYDMLVYDYLDFVGKSRHLNDLLKKRMKWVIEACRLENVVHRPIGQLSKGYKQRVCLAQALIHDPEILILDEPTSGLDPLQIVGIRNLIKELAHEKTIMVSTHILQEVTSIADRILVVNNGRIVAENTFEELELKTHHENLFYLDVGVDKAIVENTLQQVHGIDQFEFTPVSNDLRAQVRLHYTGEAVPSEIDKIVKEQGWPLNEFRKENLTLEETFIKLIEQADDSKTAANEGGQA